MLLRTIFVICVNFLQLLNGKTRVLILVYLECETKSLSSNILKTNFYFYKTLLLKKQLFFFNLKINYALLFKHFNVNIITESKILCNNTSA